MVHQQGIGHQFDQTGKRQRVFVALPAMLLVAGRQKALAQGITQEMKHGIGQRQPLQRLAKVAGIGHANVGGIAVLTFDPVFHDL